MLRRTLSVCLCAALALVFGGSTSTVDGSPGTAQQSGWVPLNLDSAYVYSLVADPSHPGWLYAGGDSVQGDYPAQRHTNFFWSRDGGSTWQRTELGTPLLPIFTLALDTTSRPPVLYASGSDGMFKGTDGGMTWTDPGERFSAEGLVIDPIDSKIMFLVVGLDAAYKSTDAAKTWHKMALSSGRCAYSSVVIARTTPETVYVGGGCGMFTSQDAGATWRQLQGAPGSVVSIAVDPRDPNHVYAGSVAADAAGVGGLYTSPDGGATWRRLDAGGRVDVVVDDPRDPETIYVAGYKSPQVLGSRDAGVSWSSVGGAAPSKDIKALVVTNGTLLAGGAGGVWKFILPSRKDDVHLMPKTGGGGTSRTSEQRSYAGTGVLAKISSSAGNDGDAHVSGVLLVGQDVTLNGKLNKSTGGALVDQGGCYFAD